ncbi:GGDEF domain-containing protein [Demequina lignilytica]|uniref:GGDEF domain-containing protein n=1 Tax=Demequina lignilytica TaxID=3051663 RepID=A0AB35MJM2_9MICO|nr:GGDEF domain-containing protein [Demequina sp. SYSU T0a273]MDN4483922.1 GGDEF domain-containing protein [Demequina sp. SYSU T0a273]
MSRYTLRGASDPLAWVFGIVLGALALIGMISIVVRASVDADSRRVSVEGVALVGDATAVQVAAATRPAETALRSMTVLLGSTPEALGDDDRVLEALASAMESQQAIAGLTVASVDGTAHDVARVEDGYAYTVTTSDGSVATTWLDAALEPTDAPEGRRPPPPVSEVVWEQADVSEPGVQWADPVVTPGGRTTITAAMVVTVPGAEPSGIAVVRLDSEMLTSMLAQSPAAGYGAARLSGADGTLLAGDADIAMPAGAETVEVENGIVRVEESLVSYERPVSDDIPWVLTVQIDSADVLPAVAAVDRTMTFFTIAIIGITGILALVLWVLRRPAGEMSLRARTDALTGLANRHHFDATGATMLYTARRKRSRSVVAVFDLDHFKSVNDGAGHESGDAALAAVADGLVRGAGPRDLVGRLGGDEFAAVLLLDDDEDPAVAVERMRRSAARALDDAVGAEFDVGVSAGWVEATGADHRLRYWIVAADEALVSGRVVEKGVAYESRRL